MQLLFRCLFFLSYSQSVNLFFCNSVDTTIFVQQQQITQVPIDTIVRVADNVGECAVTGLNQQASADADNSSSINHYNNTQRASPRQLNWEWEWEGRQKTEMILRRTETTKEEVSASRSVMWRKKTEEQKCLYLLKCKQQWGGPMVLLLPYRQSPTFDLFPQEEEPNMQQFSTQKRCWCCC